MVIANVLAFAVLVYAGWLEAQDSDLYYLSVQEDEYLEWATFWAFVGAAVIGAMAAVRQFRQQSGWPWFLAGVGLFCVFVALEEISWGQRVLGYRPPEYFLGNNFQQEFNLHNIVDTDWRKLALTATILGYGVFLPLLERIPGIGKLAVRIGIVAPPLGLAPLFVATFVLYVWYPWSHSGEWVEFLLGIGFLFGTLAALQKFSAGAPMLSTKHVVVAVVATLVLGLLTAMPGRMQREAHPGNIAAAESELLALQADFESGKVRTRCGLHKRLYTFVQEYGQDYLTSGEFAQLTAQGMPEERARYFLDPWNSPYWLRERCATHDRPRTIFVYSMGPNRRRDSTAYEVLEDDIGAYMGDSRR